jgi:hypothetical protein
VEQRNPTKISNSAINHFLRNKRNSLRHINDLIEDVDSKTQTVRDEQRVIEDNKENEHREHNVEQYEIQLEWLDDQRDLLKDLLEATQHWHKSIRRLSRTSIFSDREKKRKYFKQRAAYDYGSKAANKTFRNTRQDENNSTSDTNNKETMELVVTLLCCYMDTGWILCLGCLVLRLRELRSNERA